jgi:hypothetical protein
MSIGYRKTSSLGTLEQFGLNFSKPYISGFSAMTQIVLSHYLKKTPKKYDNSSKVGICQNLL